MSKMSAQQVMSSQCLCMNKVTFLLKLNYQVLLLNDTIIKLFKQKKNKCLYDRAFFFCKLKRNIEHWTVVFLILAYWKYVSVAVYLFE